MIDSLYLTMLDILIIIIVVCIMFMLPMQANTIIKWMFSAVIVFIICTFVILVTNYIFYKNKIRLYKKNEGEVLKNEFI